MGRLRRDSQLKQLETFEQQEDREQDILVDEAIQLTGDNTVQQYSHPLTGHTAFSRRTIQAQKGVIDVSEHSIELVTNNAYREAETISVLIKRDGR